MADNDQESQSAATPREGDRQSLLLQLAERTVVQAEALAKEITDNARQESEAEGAKILAQSTEQAKAEAQHALEVAQRRCETLINEASAKALADSEKTLSNARSESEKMLGEAQSGSEETLGKAQTEGREILGNAQIEVQEVLARVRQEALAIINTSQARADSTESNARLQAEFIIRQTTQNVADGIRSAILETCNNLLPGLEGFGKESPVAPAADQVDHAAAIETESPENAASNETNQDSSSPDAAGTDTSAQSSDGPSGRRARSSARTEGRP